MTALKNALPEIHTALPGEKASQFLEKRDRSTVQALSTIYPIVPEIAEGAMIQDVDGNIFLDWVAGVGVMNTGYGQPKIIKAIQEQAEKYTHSMINITTDPAYAELADEINQVVPTRGENRRTMFANSGAEAVENAVKIAKAATGRRNIVVFSGAFHGRTHFAAVMTAKKSLLGNIFASTDGVIRAPFPNLYRKPQETMSDDEAISYYIDEFKKVLVDSALPQDIAAVVIEPIQGEGGFLPVPFDYIVQLRKILDDYGILLIADEVQSGYARSGKMFVSNYWAELGAAPDIIAQGKSIGGGLPLSAVTADAAIMEKVAPGLLGGTFGGNALAVRAGLAVQEIIKEDQLLSRALEIGEKVTTFFEQLKTNYSVIGDVRGIGAMIGVEYVKPGTKTPFPEFSSAVINEAVKHGLIIEGAGLYNNVIRFLSPLVVTDEQLDAGLAIYEAAIVTVLSELKD
ncbi:aspartate aminotransferase family protein [Lactococcus insecticola]|uniref:4-aminobutyrate--2-oxoglutarate transaminase n=1 Tax=Pseudolactococcus insecticola TaxID=2709158 RepID=A0A6A0B7U6_9LACT|nr:aspartate aminotransferase family protein [Lactococcus insecticola]GFH40424.1 4-aminobutyrate--2-oxoglutarate transaminase [Lactococcus insecticola]